jgi:hypothetical protein
LERFPKFLEVTGAQFRVKGPKERSRKLTSDSLMVATSFPKIYIHFGGISAQNQVLFREIDVQVRPMILNPAVVRGKGRPRGAKAYGHGVTGMMNSFKMSYFTVVI